MIEIIKGDLHIKKEKNTIMQFTDTSDGLYIKFADDIEIIIPIQLDPARKAQILTATRMNAKGFKLDLNNKTNPITVDMK